MFRKNILFCILLFALSCSKAPPESSRLQKPQILVSIAPYHFLTKEIAGPLFNVQTIVPSVSNPHSFEPTASQVTQIAQAELWLQIGEPFEKLIFPILKNRNPNLVAQDLREGIALIEERHELNCKLCSMDHFDRHIWLSPKMASIQAETIERALSRQYPEHKEIFQKNLKMIQLRLSALDEELQEILKPVKNRMILVSHPAFGYFCKEYNLEQLSVEYEGKDPRPKHLEDIFKKAAAQNMEVALVLPQYNNKGAQLIAEKLHVPTHLIDPYSFDYFEMMKKLASTIKDPYAAD